MAPDQALPAFARLDLAPRTRGIERASAGPPGRRAWAASGQALADRARAGHLGADPRSAAGRSTIFPGPGVTLSNLWDQLQTGCCGTPSATTPERAVIGFGLAARHRRRSSAAGGAHPAAAGGGRFTDHRAADHAVGRLGPVRDHPVRHHHNGHLVRHRARRGPVDRQRPDRGRGLHPAAAAEGRQDDGAARVLAVLAPDPARVAAGVRGRDEAGLGVRLAQPDGRRTAGDHRRTSRPSACSCPPTRIRPTCRAPPPSSS